MPQNSVKKKTAEMSQENITGNLVVRCSEQGKIEQVLFNNMPFEAEWMVHKHFSELAHGQNLETILHFLEALKQFGNVDGWHLPIVVAGEPVEMTFSGLPLDQGFIIVGKLYQEDENLPGTMPEKYLGIGTNSQVVFEDSQLLTPDLDEHELLDELSRLNNELINSKRELINQNQQIKAKKDK